MLHQQQPVLFNNRLDLSLNFLLLTNIGNVVLNNHWLKVVLDVLYILLPVALLVSVRKRSSIQYLLAWLQVVFNGCYVLLLTSMSPLSIQWFAGFILVPIIFILKSETSFTYAAQCMRYIFILLFFSAGLWKIRAGGIFNLEQMSAILVHQHTKILLDAGSKWYEQMIRYFINHPGLSYCIYLAGTIAELSFAIGFFSKRFDRLLFVVLLLFIVLNFLFMQINYISWLAFAGCLLFSGHRKNEEIFFPTTKSNVAI